LAIAVQCLGEITVTDLTNTRTFAEEVYLQFSGDQYGLERSVALILPLIVVFVMIAGRMIRSDPVPQENSAPPLVFCLGRWRWFLLAGSALLVCVIGGAPFVALLQRAYTGPIAELWQGLFSVLRAHGKLIVESLFWSIFAGLLGSTAALALCWAAGDSSCGPDFPVGRLGKRSKWQARMPAPLGWRSKWQARMPAPCAWRRRMLFGLAITIWVTPGPVLGFGINSMIQYLLDVEDLLIGNNNDLHPLRDLLYLNPSPIPVLWAHTVRLFPFAVAILWPIVRSIPRDLIESARIDGAQGLSLFRTVVWPGTRRGFFLSLAVGTALAMGELSATKIAQVPGRRTFVEELFSQMHYGADSTVARLCLIYLVISGFLVALINRLGDFVSERQSRTYRT
jgi:ABC-type Fe3+ transport system permease subunit